MTGSPEPLQTEADSVRHLVELGYVDPVEVAARNQELRERSTADLAAAMELNAQGRSQDAVELLEQLCTREHDWPVPRQRLAEIHYNAGRLAEAQSQLYWLAIHGIDNPRSALIAGGIALARRDLWGAIEELQYAQYVDPNLPNVDTLLGTVLRRLGRLDEAEDALRRATEHNPTDARARDGLAAICLSHGEHEEAADWALRALEQDISLFQAHYHLGLALFRLNRLQEAQRVFEVGAQVDPTRAAPYRWLSRIAAGTPGESARVVHYQELGREIIRQRRARRQRR